MIKTSQDIIHICCKEFKPNTKAKYGFDPYFYKKWVEAKNEKEFLQKLLDCEEQLIDEKIRYELKMRIKELNEAKK